MTQKELIANAINEWQPVRVIGEIEVVFPPVPVKTKIANWNLPKDKQKFYYTEQPKKGHEPTEEFKRQEIDRFQNGFWFFNNGRLEWISNIHYFFLNYWKDKGKQMMFIDSQREVFCWWWMIERMDNMAGGNLVTNRRLGKTVISTCIAYFRASTNSDHRAGIQSKTNQDSKLVFGKLVKSWQKLPEWLKPIDSGETRPASVLDFSAPRGKSSKGERKIYDEVLDSSIDFRSSDEAGYDGDELHTYLEDEVGKTIGVNTDERWGVAQFCLLIGSEIVGKAIRTTTVEEMEKKGGKHFKTTWDNSAIKTLDPETGMTSTMLTNLFIPADYGLKGRHPISKIPFVDEYGYSNRPLANAYIRSLWTNLEGDKLAAAQRKNPLVIKHAFQLSNFDSVFDNELLELQKEYLENEAPKNLIRRVTFARDPDDDMVKWRDDSRGHFEMVWDFNLPTDSNKRKQLGDLWQPNNTENFAAGVDPFAATITTGPGSMGVCYIYRKGDPNDPENSGFCVLRYAQRTKYKRDFHKNVMLLCQYYGCKANYESDVDDYYEKFLEEGFKNYIMWRPKSTVDPQRKNVKTKYGTPSKDPFALQKHTEVIDEYIKTRWNKIYFIELIDQLIDYDVFDRTKFDDVIAFGMALIGGMDTGAKKTTNAKPLQMLVVKKSKKYY